MNVFYQDIFASVLDQQTKVSRFIHGPSQLIVIQSPLEKATQNKPGIFAL